MSPLLRAEWWRPSASPTLTAQQCAFTFTARHPLDFSRGFPPTLFVKNTDCLGEQIQRAFPDSKVVKSLNPSPQRSWWGAEMVLPIWVRLMDPLNTPIFNVTIVR
ncbi:hypothetical protein [Micromonospora sp. IBHARD004]|uniref:hypothetical protein n=1 Tax=Micromonospora sp. IBHARD004 TaxID=3457764 RepID=UPI004059A795